MNHDTITIDDDTVRDAAAVMERALEGGSMNNSDTTHLFLRLQIGALDDLVRFIQDDASKTVAEELRSYVELRKIQLLDLYDQPTRAAVAHCSQCGELSIVVRPKPSALAYAGGILSHAAAELHATNDPAPRRLHDGLLRAARFTLALCDGAEEESLSVRPTRWELIRAAEVLERHAAADAEQRRKLVQVAAWLRTRPEPPG